MSSSFITNKEKFLSDIINGILPKTDAVDILVGFFYFSGYMQLSEKLKDKQIRILVGLDADLHITNYIREVEAIRSKFVSRNAIKEEYYKQFVRLFNDSDFLDTAEKLEQFKMFYGKILDGTLEIRKTLEPCHSKMYLFAYNNMMNEDGELPGVLITGSSNLSYQGLKGRLELNARFNDKQDYEEGIRIFDELWDTSVAVVDKDNLDEWNTKVMAHIWYDKIYSPYLMYVRVLKEYFNIPSSDNILTPYDITEGKYSNLRYQTDAVQMALNALNNHNGAIIADVVGLGKSVIASTIARNLRLRTIIVCPPHLYKQWESYRDEFGFTATVFSAGKIEDAVSHYQELAKDGEQFLIIIDEAHRFRNEYTQDYALLHNLCSGNKVLLLTATPFNNQPADIYALIKLFQIPSHSTLKTVENLGASFKDLINKYRTLREEQREGKATEEDVKTEVDDIAKKIRSIISPLVVRRSRLDLQEIPEYANDLKQQDIQLVLPDDPEELEYDLSGLKELYLSTLDRISKSEGGNDAVYRFKAARYSPALYIHENLKEELAKELEAKTGVKFNLLIGRQTNISSFMRHLLVARFESSVAAFQASLEYMIRSSEHMLKWIGKRNKIPVFKKGNLPDVDAFYESSEDGMQEIEELFEKYEAKGFFEIDMKYVKDDFVTDVKADIQLLKNLREQWFGKDNTIKEDPKLDSFIRIILKQMKDEPNRKLVVFSEFADTVNYLGKALVDAGLPVMKYTSADATSANKDCIRANFDAGLKSSLQKNDFHILVATDAISEGYNLHRAGAIFNYDIPYNPTRVIQRIGRINRINKKVFDKLYIYNYFPTDVGEAETRTKEISTLKMAMIHAIMGEDTKALTKEEELQAYFKERYRKEFSRSEEASWDTPYRKLLNSLKGTEAYDKAMELPHRARTARSVEKSQKGVLMFGRKGNDFVFKIGNTANVPAMISAEEAISLFEAEKDEQPVDLSHDFDMVYQRVKTSLFCNDVTTRNEKELINASDKIKILIKNQLLPKDYLADLMQVIKADALSGYEIRYINQLAPKDAAKLPLKISAEYLTRIINMQNKADDSEETLILSEELQ
ncbi:SNF2-related protein [Marseilla massiliensis]|uniref:SNF2-related protein n=1 Tax=Marseilla massiliensis TaxID=1841864 RepID=UPI0020122FCD|nr:SNF2-related protein [Marseilla massiliensis]MCL1610898.1 phospholipase D-like domain-containing protein [Marseilla massiliensis]